MKLVTGQHGLTQIKLVGSPDDAFFMLHPEAKYPETKGARIAKTYRQLSSLGPRTGGSLFAELEDEDWRLPEAGRRYTGSEFDAHLRYMVERRRLHVVALGRLSPDAARELRGNLKAALTRVASGRGDIGPLLHEVERVARYVSGRHKIAFGQAAGAMRTLVELWSEWALEDTGLRGMPWDRLYSDVTDARNDVAHTGTEAVLARTRTMTLATVLMEALLGVAGEGEVNKLKDVMVPGPVCAHGWQTMADLRRTMLVTDYSELPMADGAFGATWKMVTADGLALFLATQRDERLGMTLDDATKEEDSPLRLHEAPTQGEDTAVREVRNGAGTATHLPLIVTRDGRQGPILVGIVTAFDLL